MKSDDIIEFLKRGTWEQSVLGGNEKVKIEYICYEKNSKFIQELREDGEIKIIMSGSYRTDEGKIALLTEFLRYMYSAVTLTKTI